MRSDVDEAMDKGQVAEGGPVDFPAIGRTEARKLTSEDIEAATRAFLKAGGRIKKVKPGETGNKPLKERHHAAGLADAHEAAQILQLPLQVLTQGARFGVLFDLPFPRPKRGPRGNEWHRFDLYRFRERLIKHRAKRPRGRPRKQVTS